MKKNTPSRSALLIRLHTQCDYFIASRSLGLSPDLEGLLRLLQAAKPRAKHIIYEGVTFPLRWSLTATFAVCPKTGRSLVGRFDL